MSKLFCSFKRVGGSGEDDRPPSSTRSPSPDSLSINPWAMSAQLDSLTLSPTAMDGGVLSCNFCKKQPKRMFNDYCSKTCEEEALGLTPDGMNHTACKYCSAFSAVNDSGFCSEDCERLSRKSVMPSPSAERRPLRCKVCKSKDAEPYDHFCGNECRNKGFKSGPKSCTYSGCSKEASYRDRFCTKGHAALAINYGHAKGCAVCSVVPSFEGSPYCSSACEELDINRDNSPSPRRLSYMAPASSRSSNSRLNSQYRGERPSPPLPGTFPSPDVDAPCPNSMATYASTSSVDDTPVYTRTFAPAPRLLSQLSSPGPATPSISTQEKAESRYISESGFEYDTVRASPSPPLSDGIPSPIGSGGPAYAPSSPAGSVTEDSSRAGQLTPAREPQHGSGTPSLTPNGFIDEKSASNPFNPPKISNYNQTFDSLADSDSAYVDPGSPPPYEWPEEKVPSPGPVLQMSAAPPSPMPASRALFNGSTSPPALAASPVSSSPTQTTSTSLFLFAVAPAAGPPSLPGPAHQASAGLAAEIRFTHTGGEFYGLSNYSFYDIELDGLWYPTAEHLFQALKFLPHRPDIAEQVRKISTRPSDAFEEAHRNAKLARRDWNRVNIDMMEGVLQQKFLQHPQLADLLLSTNSAQLVHDSDNPFWGIGANGSGRNELGLALMRLRDVLQSAGMSQPVKRQQTGGANAGNGGRRLTTAPNGPRCKIPKCANAPFQPGAKYCGNNHRKKAVTDGLDPACIMCKEYPKSLNHFCGQKCAKKAAQQAPLVIPLPKTDPKFLDIEQQFNASWRHGNKPRPKVENIFKIVQTDQLMKEYIDYRAKVESEGNFKTLKRAEGNECRRWHGTRRACTIGDDAKVTTPCGVPTCALCSILRQSFQVNRTGTAPGRTFERFGKGIYTSSTSSKSDDYSSNIGRSPNKAIFLTTVVVGKGHKMRDNSTQLLAPPPGCHSILGEKGNTLNFDEVVVYHNAAIRAAWLVVYR